MPAVIFDLDETLLDTSALREDRQARRWREVAGRLDEVTEYATAHSAVQAAGLPAHVKDMGYDIGVLTQSPHWYAERLLEASGIPHDALITGSDGYAPKPDPSSLIAIADDLGMPIADCVMVGDDAADIRAAQSAGALSIGVAWSQRAPAPWRRHWPDLAVARPDRLIDILTNGGPRFPYAEAILAGDQPLWHWGSLLRLGDATFAAGHYYTTSDSRHPHHALSRLIIEAKDDPVTSERVGSMLAGLFATPWSGRSVDLITSVPPKPGQDYDRFAPVRAKLAAAAGVQERGDVLRQVFDDDDSRAWRHAGSTVSVMPRCGGFLRLMTSGPYGPFIGCSNYFGAGCRYTEPAPSV